MKSARSVQHLGTWLLIAVTHQLGLYRHATSAAAGRVEKEALRLAIDAMVAALAVSQHCAEGVRRLATSTSAALLLASRAPSATWTRRVLGQFAADGGGVALHLLMAREYLDAVHDEASSAGPRFLHRQPHAAVHWQVHPSAWLAHAGQAREARRDGLLRPRRGWPTRGPPGGPRSRLADKVGMSPIACLLRMGLGEEERILLAFDRGGAFPGQMAELRDENFEFVTYERKPYQLLPASAFTKKLLVDKERLLFCEPSRANLGRGRGRVRRIAVRMPDGKQVNLLAVSRRSAKALILVMLGRWKQENGFKYGVERWGINQLDGRKVVPYTPDTIIPNPGRRRLDRALKIARASEGEGAERVGPPPEGRPPARASQEEP